MTARKAETKRKQSKSFFAAGSSSSSSSLEVQVESSMQKRVKALTKEMEKLKAHALQNKCWKREFIWGIMCQCNNGRV